VIHDSAETLGEFRYPKKKELNPMSSNESISPVEQIGHAAGCVWHKLQEEAPLSVSRLSKGIDGVSRDVVMQAIGWLAREDKIQIEETKRGRIISLK
jgi:hypothetical protein